MSCDAMRCDAVARGQLTHPLESTCLKCSSCLSVTDSSFSAGQFCSVGTVGLFLSVCLSVWLAVYIMHVYVCVYVCMYVCMLVALLLFLERRMRVVCA
ncbi:hypothetical protein F5883DRAFT_560194 [Diaporthe sp. PMI_573]|nr:hypothetical protein F5883DRAFT_560194 [Diaporthaceae sp. PMI_573]